ncbi:copper amine oxidase N-terminal domain-containing protein [Pelotomaculum terephthalicicum JT]|uniref:copper amine oxidase N-terminal domain-containing protein n=1 Tax=Pelotomaculum TaxID=191373 RepID=UPI0009CAB34D|nr:MULTISPECIES: copper amine oxidase N-terminal domain-containing protein [Pelotomaculum]MCG9969029.1 copper amine oxidase N-terminal domain-containing protein [Pelotomaculum terephthalicicum JT]OPX91367.1 MAG: hypothetical protein A4E54_00315 [Pelotomaculum sp. PtaB.Bin117]OPY60598.1 MAG: hypothetical protein A4E56_02603 [Pelotomaculum sp. PtaU1.Bin065]
MKRLKQGLILLVAIGLLCISPVTFNQAAADIPPDSVLYAKGGNSHGGSNSGAGPNSSSSSKSNASQNQTQTAEQVQTRKNTPDKVNGQHSNRIMENARGTLKQIQEQTATGDRWQEMRGQLSQVKEQYKSRQVTREEAKALLNESLTLAEEQQNLEEQENCLEDLAEIDPADQETYKKLGATYRMRGRQGVKVFSNGTEIKFDVPPVIKEGRTLIPVRALTEGFGATVDYDAENQTVTVTKGETTIVLTLGQNVALVNGQEVTLDAKAELNNSRTIVPLRFIAETFKLNVDNPDEDIVTVNDPATDTTTEDNTGDTSESGTDTTTDTTTDSTDTTDDTTDSTTDNTTSDTTTGDTSENDTNTTTEPTTESTETTTD